MSSLTLNKITSQRGISVGEATKKISDLGWNPTYVQEAMTFPTDYKIAKAPRDPMKQVLRSYFPMQEEKDNRVYGALDAALRGDMFRNVEPRWVEWMKLFLAIIPFPEISAARSMAMVGRLAPGEELRTGFTMQMVDEFRTEEGFGSELLDFLGVLRVVAQGTRVGLGERCGSQKTR